MSSLAVNPRLTPTGVELPDDMSFEQWAELLRRVAKMQNASTWALAQIIFYGQGRYGQRYEEAIAATGLSYKTCANLACVAGQYDSSRIRENLSFGHHAEVAALSDEDRDAWLDRCEKYEWNSLELREARRREGLGTAPGTIEKLCTLSVHATEAERDQWLVEAELAGMHVRDWLRKAANDAVALSRAPS